ncbi:MAG: molybdopterin-synthase adenylyltransferase MoeB [Pseudomonadota bacterium]
MLTDQDRERFLRHILLKEVGAQGQMKLKAARVLVVGAGGLGAPVIQYLAAAGVGMLTIIDDDHVDLSNLQRQVIYRQSDVDLLKAQAAADAALAMYDGLNVHVASEKLNAENADALVSTHDLVVEGIDNFEGRYAVNAAAMKARVPLISAAIGQFSGQVATFKPYAGDLPCYRCLVPEAPPRDAILTCAEEGVLGPLAGVVGSMAALEVLKEIVGFGESLAGRLLVYDGLAQRMRNIALPRDPSCVDCGALERPVSDPRDKPMRLA